MKSYYVYLMSDRHRGALYTGVTSDLERRVAEHKSRALDSFSSKYHVHVLVYFEATTDIRAAIACEKQIKVWTRAKKTTLIESVNPRWEDLSEAWSNPAPPPDSFATVRPFVHRATRRSE